MDEERLHDELMAKIMELGNPRYRRSNIERDYDITKNVNSEACKMCGGKCCQKCGCHFAPSDFKDLTFEGLKQEIEKGYISIDCIDGEMFYQRGFFYMLRARNVGAPIVDFGYKRSACCLLTENGCKLDYESRPSGGRLLIPVHGISGGKKYWMCTQKYEVEDCCYEWKQYESIISQLVEYFKDKDYPCTLWRIYEMGEHRCLYSGALSFFYKK